MKQVARTLILFFFVLNGFAEVKPEKTFVFFDTDSYVISQKGKQVLDSLISTINIEEDLELFLDGHTDSEGNDAYNIELSSNRVKAVQEYLLAKGLSSNQVVSNHFGEAQPDLPNNNAFNKSKNRRVELRILRYSFSSLEDLDEMLASEKTEIEIDPSVPNTIEADQGSIITFEQNAFLDKNGNVFNGQVKIEITEALGVSDFVAHNLMTISGNQMLESGGMLKITANGPDGQELELDPNKPMQISVPGNQLKKGMTVFTSETGADWTNTSNEVRVSSVVDQEMASVIAVDFQTNYIRIRNYPVFRRNYNSRPEYPWKPNAPNKPKEPRESTYFKKLAWHQKAIAPIIKARQKKAYAAAYARYLVKLDKYRTLQDRFETRKEQFDIDLEQYKIDIVQWEKQQVYDSLNFKNSPQYLEVLRFNEEAMEFNGLVNSNKRKAWLEKQDSVFASVDDRGELNTNDLNGYFLSHNQLSWINIDRFLKLKDSQIRPITMKDPDATRENVLIVFQDIKSTMPLRKKRSGNAFIQKRIPKRTNATLVSYKVEDGRIMVYHQKIGRQNKYTPTYKAYKFKEFKKFLEDLQA